MTRTPGLTVCDIDHDIATLAARVRSETGLKIPDAYQIATGVHHQATALVTNDRDLARFKDLEVLTRDDFVHVDGEPGSNP
ncbi:MAG: PIN domain-containing protein [Planctomycetes bacterium]|nr:PIN domain-containing protein [Planctomycetota bacterium]